jgi:hypothetical protein
MRHPVLSADAPGNGSNVGLGGHSPTCTKKLAAKVLAKRVLFCLSGFVAIYARSDWLDPPFTCTPPEFERLVCVA